MMTEKNEVLEREYESIQWIWRVVMGFSMLAGAQIAYAEFIEPLVLRLYGEDASVAWTSGLLFLALFVPAHLIAVTSGNRYINIAQRMGIRSDRRVADLLGMILQGILFIFLARALPQPEVFLSVLACLQALSLSYWAVAIRDFGMSSAWGHFLRQALLLVGFITCAVLRALHILDPIIFATATASMLGLSLVLEIHWTMWYFFPRLQARGRASER